MASFKGSSDCSRPCPVMCSIPPEMGIPQLSSPALMLEEHFFCLIRISVHSSFFHFKNLTPSRTTILQAGETALCPFPRCVSAWRGCTNAVMVHHRLHPPEWLRASPLGYFSSPVLFLLWESLEEHSTSHVLDRGEALAWLDLLSHPPSQPQALAADSRRTCCSQTPWSCSAPQCPRPTTVRQIIPPHTRGLAERGWCRPSAQLAAGPSEQRNKQQRPPAWSHPGASRGQAQPPHPATAHCVSTLLCSKTIKAQHIQYAVT